MEAEGIVTLDETILKRLSRGAAGCAGLRTLKQSAKPRLYQSTAAPALRKEKCACTYQKLLLF